MSILRIAQILVSFLIAPLVPGLLIASLDAFAGHARMAMWYIQFSAAVGYPIAIVLGIPTHLMLSYINKTQFRFYLAAGGFFGIVAFIMPFLIQDVFSGAAEMYRILRTPAAVLLAVSAICGMIAASAFWLLARPDRAHRRSIDN